MGDGLSRPLVYCPKPVPSQHVGAPQAPVASWRTALTRAAPSLADPDHPLEDAFFKQVFSHPRTIELLIRAEIPEWAGAIDHSSLRRLPADFVDDDLRQRYADRVWRGRSLDAGTEYLLLLEFQGRPDPEMALRTADYAILAIRELRRRDKALARGDRRLATACLVLYHGDRPWNAPKRLRDVYLDATPTAYRLVSRRPRDAPPPTPLDLPRMLLGLVRIPTAQRMRSELAVLQRAVRDCRDDEFDRLLTRAVKAMLRSRGMSSDLLEEANTMDAVATTFQRSLEEIRREGIEEGIERGQVSVLREFAARKFGSAVAETLVRELEDAPDATRVAKATKALLDCDAADDFVNRVREG